MEQTQEYKPRYEEPKDILTLVDKDKKARHDWEESQNYFYNVRMNGIRRSNKEDWQADLPMGLIETSIRKIKPFYSNQIFQSELLTDFNSLEREQRPADVAKAAFYFDFKIRQESNFADEILSVTDSMLAYGFGICMPEWDLEKENINFNSIEPIDVIVPKNVKHLQKADRITVRKKISVQEYERSESFKNKDKDFVKKITGKASDLNNVKHDDDKNINQGLETNTDDELIVFYETYVNEGKYVMVYTSSPFCNDEWLREPYILPYKFRGKCFIPLVQFPFEIISTSNYYAPRGLAQILVSDEAEATKIRNLKLDYVTQTSNMMFRSTPDAGENPKKFKLGDLRTVLPTGIEPVFMGQTNYNFDLATGEILTRAEQKIMMPDFSAGNGASLKDSRTAAEINAITGVASQGINLNARIFRSALSELYRYAWAIISFHADPEEFFRYQGDFIQMDKSLLHTNYEIYPEGNPDFLNKSQRIQQKISMFQLVGQDPSVNREEMIRDIMTDVDAKLARKTFVGSGVNDAKQSEAQAAENLLLVDGYPAVVEPTDNHSVHIKVAQEKKIQIAMGQSQPSSPDAINLLDAHIMTHLNYLTSVNSQLAGQIKTFLEQSNQQIEQMQMQQQAQQMQQQQMANAPAQEEARFFNENV